jgi:hypothetical protein
MFATLDPALGFATGRQPARERTMKLAPPVKPIPAKQIRAIRLGLGSRSDAELFLQMTPILRADLNLSGNRVVLQPSI